MRGVEGVVGFIDDGGIVFYFGDLAVVSYYAVVAASDACRAGVGVVGVRGKGGDRGYFIDGRDALNKSKSARRGRTTKRR